MIAEERLVKLTVGIIQDVQSDIRLLLEMDRPSAVQKVAMEWKDEANITRAVDITSELRFKALLYKAFKSELGTVLGEESLSDESLDLSGVEKPVALLDIVDGTDLLVRDLSNWCSAVVFFLPAEQRILAAFVGDSLGRVYVACDSDDSAYMVPLGGTEETILLEPSKNQHVGESYLGFYGQKRTNFCSVLEREHLLERMHRIYNLGGNPMLAKVADGSMDGVFELIGQAPHDAVPGLYIARKAGASVSSVDGAPLDLEAALLRPASPDWRLRYIAACNEKMRADLQECLMKGLCN